MTEVLVYAINGAVVLLAVALGSRLSRTREKETWMRDQKLRVYTDLDQELQTVYERYRAHDLTRDDAALHPDLNLLVSRTVSTSVYALLGLIRENLNRNVAGAVSIQIQMGLVREGMREDLGVAQRASLREVARHRYNLLVLRRRAAKAMKTSEGTAVGEDR